MHEYKLFRYLVLKSYVFNLCKCFHTWSLGKNCFVFLHCVCACVFVWQRD